MLRLLLGSAVIGFTMLVKGDFEPDTNKPAKDPNYDPNFVPKFEQHISFRDPTGVNIPCGLHYWVSRNRYNTEFPGRMANTKIISLRFKLDFM